MRNDQLHFLNRLQKVQNTAACLILKAPRTDHTTRHLHTLHCHWLPITARIKYWSSLYFSAITSTGPVYLSDLLKIYTPSRHLKSSADSRILCSEQTFSYIVPTLWNTLLKEIRFSESASSFKSALKTHLFPTYSVMSVCMMCRLYKICLTQCICGT